MSERFSKKIIYFWYVLQEYLWMWLLCIFDDFIKNLGTSGHILMINHIFLLTHRNTKSSILVLELEDFVIINQSTDYIHSHDFSPSLTDNSVFHTKVKYRGQNAASFTPYNSTRSIGIDAKNFKTFNQMQRLNPRGLNKDTENF